MKKKIFINCKEKMIYNRFFFIFEKNMGITKIIIDIMN